MRTRWIIAFLVCVTAQPSAAEAPLFADKALFKATLSAPLGQVYEQKDLEKRLYFDGSWAYRNGENTVRLPVKVRTRGNYRRQVCELPPLQLNFRKNELEGTLFQAQNKLKMVSPCKDDDKYQQMVFLEYHLYELFALFSEHHFRVRPVEVGYTDSDRPDSHWSSTNFLLEDDEAMAERSGLELVKVERSLRTEMDLAHTALVEIFQFMIGNNDYSTLQVRPGEDCCHNVKLIAEPEAKSGFIPVPYDFDASGLVNAPYAEPPANLPIRDVKQRYFTGWCKEEARYREALDRVNGLREPAMALFAESTLLDKRYRGKAVDYLEKSYELLNDKRYFEKYILERCRGEVIKG